jgi:hypothetical protein
LGTRTLRQIMRRFALGRIRERERGREREKKKRSERANYRRTDLKRE